MADTPQPPIDRAETLDRMIETLDQLHLLADEHSCHDLAYLLALARREARERRRALDRH